MSVKRSAVLVAALAASTVTFGTAGVASAAGWEDSPVHAKWRDLGGASFAGDKVGDEVVLDNGIRWAKFAKHDIVITWREGAGAHWMSGAISRKWLSGGTSASSAATMDQVPVNRGAQAGAAIAYDTGYSVYYSDAYGAFSVAGRQRDKYWANGAVTGRFGWPVSDQIAMADNGGVAQQFSEAVTLYQQVPAQSESFWISGALNDKYRAKGGPNGFGWLERDQDAVTGNGWSVRAAKGTIYWSAGSGAHALSTKSDDAFGSRGGVIGELGYPTSDTVDVAGGQTTDFAGRTLYVTPEGPAWRLAGGVRDEYNLNGGPAGPLGWPQYDQLPAPGTDGEYAVFGADRDKVVLWGPRTGASVVSGPILRRLRADGDVAVYGLPQYGEMATGEYRFQQFENATVFVLGSNVYTLGWDFRAGWWATGGTQSWLGMVASDMYLVGDDIVQQDFVNGSIRCDYNVGMCFYSGKQSSAQSKQAREEGTSFRATTPGPRK